MNQASKTDSHHWLKDMHVAWKVQNPLKLQSVVVPSVFTATTDMNACLGLTTGHSTHDIGDLELTPRSPLWVLANLWRLLMEKVARSQTNLNHWPFICTRPRASSWHCVLDSLDQRRPSQEERFGERLAAVCSQAAGPNYPMSFNETGSMGSSPELSPKKSADTVDWWYQVVSSWGKIADQKM